jgi:tetratricopeptide (TPR) repeat protein
VLTVLGVLGVLGVFGVPIAAQEPSARALADRYALGEHDAVRAALRDVRAYAAFGREIERATEGWRSAANRRAVLFLDVAAAFPNDAPEGVAEGRRLIEVACAQLRRARPGPFERRWHVAAMALLHRNLDSQGAEEHIAHVRARFLDEPTFVLAYAIAQDQRTSPMSAQSSDARLQEAVLRYESAARFPPTAVEAKVRMAYALHRLARYQDAAALVEGLDAGVKDRRIVYWIRFVRGLVQQALGRTEQAGLDFASALVEFPNAQSARNAMTTVGATAAPAQSSTPGANADDPWLDYWYGDFRFFPAVMNDLRAAVRPR